MSLKDRKQEVFRYLATGSLESIPSVRELCNEVGVKSTSTMFHILHELEKDGLITMKRGKRRNISIVRPGNLLQVPLLRTLHSGVPDTGPDNLETFLPFLSKNGSGDLVAVRADVDGAGIQNGDIVLIEIRERKTGGIFAIERDNFVRFSEEPSQDTSTIGTVAALIRYF